MKNNPYAKVFREAFCRDVLDNMMYIPTVKHQYPARVEKFMGEFNRFLQIAGESVIPYKSYLIREEKLFDYSLFMRGYMRDSQEVLANLQSKHALDPDLISLFQAASNYLVAASHNLNQKKREAMESPSIKLLMID